MKILDKIIDNRIKATNVLIETTLGEYEDLALPIIRQNSMQRNRVKTSGSVYSLLKTDLREGIVIPPIVLGLSVDEDIFDYDFDKILELVNLNKHKLVILDGLQRTYTIRDLLLEEANNDDILKKIKLHPLRIEIYIGIEKIGILYRMLTLNTGQTPMSTRHQIEIIYSDYIDVDLKGIRLIKQIENETPNSLGEYNFRDIIDGFTSYLDRDYLSIERTDILDNIRSLEKLANIKEGKDIFQQFLIQFDAFVNQINNLSQNWQLSEDSLGKSLGGLPFAKTPIKMFNRSQVMTGFGSAIGRLIDLKAISDLDELSEMIMKIKIKNPQNDFNNLIIRLDDLRAEAKKIGNDQRLFFHFFFRELFDRKSDTFLEFGNTIDEAYRQYERRTK